MHLKITLSLLIITDQKKSKESEGTEPGMSNLRITHRKFENPLLQPFPLN